MRPAGGLFWGSVVPGVVLSLSQVIHSACPLFAPMCVVPYMRPCVAIEVGLREPTIFRGVISCCSKGCVRSHVRRKQLPNHTNSYTSTPSSSRSLYRKRDEVKTLTSKQMPVGAFAQRARNAQNKHTTAHTQAHCEQETQPTNSTYW